jgi:hypothetical protein
MEIKMMNRTELKNKIGEYVETGLKLIAVGSKYAYYYSIWDDGTGKNSGYCRRGFNKNDPSYSLQFIAKSQVRIK